MHHTAAWVNLLKSFLIAFFHCSKSSDGFPTHLVLNEDWSPTDVVFRFLSSHLSSYFPLHPVVSALADPSAVNGAPPGVHVIAPLHECDLIRRALAGHTSNTASWSFFITFISCFLFPASTFITSYLFANLFVLSPTIYEFHESRPCLFLLSRIYHSAWKSVNVYAQGDRHTDFCCSPFSYKQKWPKYPSTEWWTMDLFTYGPYTLATAYHYCASCHMFMYLFVFCLPL